MPGAGFKSVSIKEETYRRLEKIVKEIGARSISEAIARIVEDWERIVLPMRKKSDVVKMVLRLIGVKQRCPEHDVIDYYLGVANQPLVYLTIDIYENGEKLIIEPVIALNPKAVLDSYCTEHQCSLQHLLHHIQTGLKYLREKANKAFSKIPRQLLEILKQFNIEVRTEPRYVVRVLESKA